MPVSKNKRKSKKGQSRKVNRAKSGGDLGGSGVPDTFDPTPPTTPANTVPGLSAVGTGTGESAGTGWTHPTTSPCRRWSR